MNAYTLYKQEEVYLDASILQSANNLEKSMLMHMPSKKCDENDVGMEK